MRRFRAVFLVVALLVATFGTAFYLRQKHAHDLHLTELHERWRRDTSEVDSYTAAYGRIYASAKVFDAAANRFFHLTSEINTGMGSIALLLDRTKAIESAKRSNDNEIARFLREQVKPRGDKWVTEDVRAYEAASQNARDALIEMDGDFTAGLSNPSTMLSLTHDEFYGYGRALRLYADSDDSLLQRISSVASGSVADQLALRMESDRKAYERASTESISQWILRP